MNAANDFDGAFGDVDEAAAYWCALVEAGEATPEERRAFDAWIAESPEHRRAYESFARLWAKASALAPRVVASRPQLDVVATSAPTTAAPATSAPAPPASAGASRAFPTRAVAGALAAGLALCVTGAWAWRAPMGVETLSTAVGEQREIALPDGSRLTLNTATVAEVRFSRAQRRIELRSGQARFDVAHDAKRPFIVDVGDGEVRAVGTRFDVYRQRTGDVVVTMIEGEVAVRPERGVFGASEPPTHVIAGEQVAIQADGDVGDVRDVDVASAVGWTSGRLDFSNTPLGEAVAEVNRYARTQIVIADSELAAIPVSGSFKAGEPDTFAAAAEALFDLKARRIGDRIVLAR